MTRATTALVALSLASAAAFVPQPGSPGAPLGLRLRLSDAMSSRSSTATVSMSSTAATEEAAASVPAAAVPETPPPR